MIAVQAETARLTTADLPAARAQRLSAIGDTARAALTEMRRLLGVLREDTGDSPADLSPQPGLRQLNELLDQARDASASSTRLIVQGSPASLAPGVELAGYRIVQEALTNSRRHAPGAAVDVELHYTPRTLRVRIRDNGPGPPAEPVTARPGGTAAGHGLLGMRERAAAVGGSLRAGLADNGGFMVEAILPAVLSAGTTSSSGPATVTRPDPPAPAAPRSADASRGSQMTSDPSPSARATRSPAASGAPIRIVVADDHEVVRTGFAALLSTQPDFTVVGTAGDGAEAARICAEQHPDVVLMDVHMPGMDGIAATRQVAGSGADAPRILILTTFDLDDYVYDALLAGASGFLLKDVIAERLFDAVRVVAAGDALLAPAVTRRLISEFARLRASPSARDNPGIAALTPRETEVLKLVAEGLSNPEIAGRLVVTEETVKSHVSRILSKLGLRGRTQAVVTAYESGLVIPRSRPQGP